MIPGLLCSFALLLAAIPANAQSTGRVTPITTEQPPVTSDFILLIDARQTMGLNTDTSGTPFGRLHMAVAAANSAVQAIPVGSNLAVVVLQDNVRTLRPLWPLQASDRKGIQATLSKLTATGDAPIYMAFQHLRDEVLVARPDSNVFLLVATDGNDLSFDRTLTEVQALSNREGSTRGTMLAMYVADSSRTNLQQLAQAVHSDDNAHQVLHHGHLPAALLSLQSACDAIESDRQLKLSNAASDLKDRQKQVGDLQNKLAALQLIEKERDELQNRLNDMTTAEAAQRAEANRLRTEVATLKGVKAAAEQKLSQLESSRHADNLAAIRQQTELDNARSSLTTTQTELKAVTTERKTLHKQVVQDVELKRGLESELKSERTRAILLQEQLQHERKARLSAAKSSLDESSVAAAVRQALCATPVGQFLTSFWGLLTIGGASVLGAGGTATGLHSRFKQALLDNLQREDEKRSERVKELDKHLDDVKKELLHDVKQAIADQTAAQQTATASLDSSLTDAKQSIEESLSNAADKLVATSSEQHRESIAQVNAVSTAVQDATQSVQKSVDDAADKLGNANGSRHRETTEQIRAVGEAVKTGDDAILRAIDGQKTDQQKATSDLGDAVKDATRSVQKSVDDAADKLDNSNGCRHRETTEQIKAVGEAVKTGDDAILRAIDGQKADQQKATSDLGDAVKDATQSVQKAVDDAADKLDNANGCRHRETTDQIKAVGDTVKAGDDAIIRAIDDQKADQQRTTDDLGTAIKDAKQTVQKSVDDAADKLDSANGSRHRETTDQIKAVGDAVKAGDGALKDALDEQKADQQKATGQLADTLNSAADQIAKSADNFSKTSSEFSTTFLATLHQSMIPSDVSSTTVGAPNDEIVASAPIEAPELAEAQQPGDAGSFEGPFETELINGIGPGLAKKLASKGVSSLKELSETQAGKLASIRGISIENAHLWIAQAKWALKVIELTLKPAATVVRAIIDATESGELVPSERSVDSPDDVEAVVAALKLDE